VAEFHNPQNEPGSEKRMMLVFLIAFGALALMRYLVPSPPAAPPPKQPAQQQQSAPSSSPASSSPSSSVNPKQPSAVPVKKADREAETVVENQLYRIVFSSRGALVKSWVLKKYNDDQGKPLDLVNATTAPVVGYPLSFFAYDHELEQKLNQALYVPSAVGAQEAPAVLSFEFAEGDISVRKTFSFDLASYVVDIETEVTDKGRAVTAYPAWPGGLGDQTAPAAYAASRIDWEQNGNVERNAPQSGWLLTGKKWVIGGQTYGGPFEWVAAVDQYFTAAFMPNDPGHTAVVTLNHPVDIGANTNTGSKSDAPKTEAAVLGVAVGGVNGSTHERLFVGPKSVDVLEKTQAQPGGPDLRQVVDFGFFKWIARPLFAWLEWTHDHWINNWGWTIAFATLVISLALLPLRISSIKSSLKMQKIQPQVKAITEKYKRYSITDPRRADMQKEMSELYRREGVNPVGGCFPLLLQMPFLFAFYSMLGNATELRQAHWMWVHDLSAPDPWHILPLGIIVTMFLTQKSTPQAGMDPMQQKMLSFMTPLMLGFISWNLAAGVGIYWAISNFIGYGQQFFMNRTQFGQQVRKSVDRRATRKK